MVTRKPVPANPNLPDSLRVGPPQGPPPGLPQYDGGNESRPQPTPQDDIPPALSPGSVPVYQERNPARLSHDGARSAEVGRVSAEVRRMSEDINDGWSNLDRPQNPPEFAHLAVASAKNLSPPTQQFSNLHVADDSNVSDFSRGNTAQSYPTISSDSRGNTAQSYINPQHSGHNPWGDSMPVNGMLHAPPEPATLHRVTTADSANDAWAYEAVGQQPPPPNRVAPGEPGGAPLVPGQQHVSVPVSPQELPAYQQESPGWDEEEAQHVHTPLYTPPSNRSASTQKLAVLAQAPPLPDKGVSGARTPEVDQGSSSANPWDDAGSPSQGGTFRDTQPPPVPAGQAPAEGGVQDIGHSIPPTSPTGKQESGVVTSGGDHILDQPINPPALPPRNSEEVQRRVDEGIPPVMPPRPSLEEQPWANVDGYAPPPGPPPGHSPNPNDEKYHIKKITWYDHTSNFNPRVSPILTQNANGPCPLLALVNAMILSTPSDARNEVGQYLAHKTEVSLDDLLQAMINEYLSEDNCRKRAQAGQEEYPDIGELHDFLKRLHTGMNVNPRFIPPDVARSPDSMRNSMSHVHPSQRSEESIPGGFEQTKELDLYASFGIRLIHGWLPEPTSPAYKAFRKHAQSHEDAQLLLLRADDLEAKLQNPTTGGLTEPEAELLQDIYLMSSFLHSNPTQLSPFGLEALRTSLRNGEFAILFRNSHFLVVYKHPETEMLFCLVSDEGYRESGDVVWESLMDCDGSSMEIFSGDFSILSGADQASRSGGGGGGAGSSSTLHNSSPSGVAQRPGLDTIASDWSGEVDDEERRRREREDADMAFALQVQDEFNEESEAQEARRRREQELSERFIESSRNSENETLPINRPEGGVAPAPGRGGRGAGGAGMWASRGGAGPIGPAANALPRHRTSMLDPSPSSPIGVSGPRVPIPTRRRSSAQTPISPITGNPRLLPTLPIPIGRSVDGPLRVVNYSQNDNSGIPQALLQQPARPHDPEAGVDNPPPSYEQAASQPKYEGPIERPAGGPAVAGGVIGEAAGVHEDARSSMSSSSGQQGLPGVNSGVNRRQSTGLGLRETLSAQARRVSEMRRQQVVQQTGVTGAPQSGVAPDGSRRRDEGDCVVM